MKIKQRKYMTEKEALNWLIDNSETLLGIELESNAYGDKYFQCDFRYDERLCWTKDGRYYIDEEVEITEETPLLRAMVIKDNLQFYSVKNRKISNLKTKNIKFIYLQNADGSIGELIWSKERGLVD